jgi:hypothetical protein
VPHVEHHVTLPGSRYRPHLAHVGNHAQRFLDRLGQEVLDLRGRRADQLGAHGERRIGQVRQQVDLEIGEGNQPEQDHRDGRHRDGHATADGELDDVHSTASST